MTELEKQDLEDGCACILAEAWTPAAMIIMRSIESGVRTYYKKLTKKDPSKKPWSSMITELEKLDNVDSKFLAHLDYLKDFRNRLSHPDARFTQEETEDVLNQAIHIFNRLYSLNA